MHVCSKAKAGKCDRKGCLHFKPHLPNYEDCLYDGMECWKCVPIEEDFITMEDMEI